MITSPLRTLSFINGIRPGKPVIYAVICLRVICPPNSPGFLATLGLICISSLTPVPDMRLTRLFITSCRSVPWNVSPFPFFLRGIWPVSLAYSDERFSQLPVDFEDRLSRAFAHHIWPLLIKNSPVSAFSLRDPLVVLSHNLDFWLPYLYRVIEDRLRGFPRCDFETPDQAVTLLRLRCEVPEGVTVDLPRKGGDIWAGEADAWKVAQELVEAADRHGRLRAVIDAVLSNRIQDDFSDCWSYDREDFERKFYHKRSKVKVAFVEIPDTVPVHGPDSECAENLLWEDFITLLDKKEHRIVVCLRKGITGVGEIGRELGYANHSPVSKALKKIRIKAQQYFES